MRRPLRPRLRRCHRPRLRLPQLALALALALSLAQSFIFPSQLHVALVETEEAQHRTQRGPCRMSEPRPPLEEDWALPLLYLSDAPHLGAVASEAGNAAVECKRPAILRRPTHHHVRTIVQRGRGARLPR